MSSCCLKMSSCGLLVGPGLPKGVKPPGAGTIGLKPPAMGDTRTTEAVETAGAAGADEAGPAVGAVPAPASRAVAVAF